MADDDTIKQLEQKVADAQAELADAKKQAAAKAARQRVLDAIQTQRAVSQTVVTAADTQQGQWATLIAGKLPQQDRDELQGKIDAAMQEVTEAQAQVTALATTVTADTTALAAAEDSAAGQGKRVRGQAEAVWPAGGCDQGRPERGRPAARRHPGSRQRRSVAAQRSTRTTGLTRLSAPRRSSWTPRRRRRICWTRLPRLKAISRARKLRPPLPGRSWTRTRRTRRPQSRSMRIR